MKVLFFLHSFPCVSETFVLNQVTGLIDKGHDVKVYAWGKGDSCLHEDYVKYNLNNKTWRLYKTIPQSRIIRLITISPYIILFFMRYGKAFFTLFSPQYGRFSMNLTLLYISLRLIKEKWSPDVIISHFGDNGLLMNAMKKAGIVEKYTPCYTFFHAHEICRMSDEELSRFYKPMFESDDYLLPISDYWRQKLLRSGANTKNVKKIHMGIDPSRFIYIEPTFKKDFITILSVGRLVGQKGYEYSIQGVASYIKNTTKKVKYLIIGKGELENHLKRLVEQLCIEEHVDFLGAQPQEVVARNMANADVFLLPSVTDDLGFMEGIPVALMEAMARGVICVSTYHSGIPELIENEVSGFLCEEKNSWEISQALMKIERCDESDIKRMSLAAREKVIAEFNVNTLLINLDKLVKNE